MGIFNFRQHEDMEKGQRTFSTTLSTTTLMQAVDYKLLRQVTDELTAKIVDHIYDDVVKAIDKELIVKEVSAGVSQEVLKSMYGRMSQPKTNETLPKGGI